MRKVWLGVFAAALLLAACAAPQPVQMQQRQTKFDYASHKPYTLKGANTIEGQAFLRSQCGGFLPCAGDEVLLMPATPYFREELSIVRAGNKPSDQNNPDAKTVIKHSKLDPQGSFIFSDVPDGTWFVVVKVKWAASFGYSPQGGLLWREVTVAHGETKQVRLTG